MMLALLIKVLVSLIWTFDNIAGKLELVTQQLTAIDAEWYCQTNGGHLVSIHSEQENDEVHRLCSSAGSNCWIGLHVKSTSEVWTDGSQVDYRNFKTGQPDGEEHCTMMMSFILDGKWSDEACTAGYDHAHFVCKYGSNLVTNQPIKTQITTHNVPTTKQMDTAQPTTDKATIPTVPTKTDTAQPTTAKVTTRNIPTTSNAGNTSGITGTATSYKLRVDGSHFTMNNQRVFLSGANQAWVAYAYDFGNNQYKYRQQKYEQVLDEIHQSGGNSVRVWIHIEGETSPQFDDNTGMVTGLDKDGTFISDMRDYLQAARRRNILVFPTLWNGAVKQSFWYRLDGLIKDPAKLQSYLDNALVPMVMALKNEPALGGWDIMNEPEGKLKPDLMNTDPCFDTTFLHNSGAGWAGQLNTAQEFARFINWQANAIRSADPEAMVTVGGWSEIADTDQFGLHNLYKDECLIKAGGKNMGTLTFNSIHTYDWNGKYNDHAPFKVNATDYGLGKPVVIAEFNQQRGGGMTFQQQFEYAYNHGYAGAWTWSQTDGDWSEQRDGMAYIRNKNDQSAGGIVDINLN